MLPVNFSQLSVDSPLQPVSWVFLSCVYVGSGLSYQPVLRTWDPGDTAVVFGFKVMKHLRKEI